MAVVLMIMAQQTKPNCNNATPDQLKPMLYDFLGMKPADSSPVVLPPKPAVSLPSSSISVSLGASSSAPGLRGPISSTSDLGSERQARNHLEGVPFYNTRSDICGPEISNRIVGNKRSNSESAFMGHEYPEGLHLMKLLRNGAGGEQPRRSNDDEVLCGMQQLRPTSTSLILPPSASSRMDPNVSRWERTTPMNAGPAGQYHSRGGQLVPFMQQAVPNRFKDAHAASSIMSQSAADEGSRTGIKGPGILSSVNATGGVSEKNSSALLQGGTRPKSGTLISEPESSTPPSQQGLASASRQMTIFYGGQAHVFDDVHPNKADVIMALAGSNGGSWSTTYSSKSTAKPVSENLLLGGYPEARIAGNMALPQELRGRLSVTGNTSHGSGSNDQISTPTGFTKNRVQAAEPSTEEKSDK